MAFNESRGGEGIMMGGEGPMMSGTWVNPKTGHKFTVQDCFFQDGNFMVQTTTGQMLDYNTIQHYVQAAGNGSVPIQKQQPVHKKQNPKPQPQEVPEDIMNQILPEDMEAIGLGNINKPARNNLQPVNTTMPPTVDPDIAMIERVLKNHAAPKADISIDWQPVPIKQMQTLVEILGVDSRKIADYYVNKIDTAQIISDVKEAIIACIKGIVDDTYEPPTVIEDPEIGDPINKEDKPLRPLKPGVSHPIEPPTVTEGPEIADISDPANKDEKPRTIKKKVTKKTKK